MPRLRSLALAGMLAGMLIAGMAIGTTPAEAVKINDVISIGAQLRTRFVYSEGKDFNLDNNAMERIENRARINIDLTPTKWLRGFLEVQDVRAWGEETDTLTDFTANGFDLHQGYADFRPTQHIVFRVGRQEINWEGQRLIGAVGWTPQGRSFDALRAMVNIGKQLSLDAFFSMILEDDAVPAAVPVANATRGEAGGLNARYLLLKKTDALADISFTGIVDYAEATDRTRVTLGLRHVGEFGIWRHRLEGYYQLGGLGSGAAKKDISAYMVGFRGGVLLARKRLSIDLWADLLSGTSTAANKDFETFNTLFATNHKFYGYSDFFLDIPGATGGKGLIDLALKFGFQAHPNVRVGLDGHYMMAPNPQGGPSDWGTEIDFVTTWKPVGGVSLLVGVFTMLPGEALQATRAGNKQVDIGFNAQVQADL